MTAADPWSGELRLDLASALPPFAARYKPVPGIFDEMIDERGGVRPHWAAFLAALPEWGPSDIARTLAQTKRHLRDAGVFYRVYDDPLTERPWPLSHMPVVLGQAEFRNLEQGIIQRAEILERLLADLYGPADLVRGGVLPAAAVAGSPEFLRSLVGVTPAGGHYLHFCAFDLGRGPDGGWWVLGDRTQAPSGAGYALENRIALSRALPEVYRGLSVERLAGFFQEFRAALVAGNRHDDSRVGLLTPGRLNETYFEHAYLARYLGFVLVEGEDLSVRGDEVFIRTIAGLKRAEVLWRRLDSAFADPLELNPSSRIGAPGLVQAARAGQVLIANALGAGLAESRSLLGFMPKLARALLNEPLRLPNIATWWCGQQRERDHVIANLDRLAIAPSFQSGLPGVLEEGARVGSDLDPRERGLLIEAIRERGIDFVGQEAVKLSTTPVLKDGELQPRPLILRLFAARTARGWSVMPGGFCRISDEPDARAVSMQRGGRSADLWVLADGPVDQTSLLPAQEGVAVKRITGSLPSRAADNLFWLGRYVERAEAALRVVRALAARAMEGGDPRAPAIQALTHFLIWNGGVDKDVARDDPGQVAAAALRSPGASGSAPDLLIAARGAASAIRDRFSPDAWRTLDDLVSLLTDETRMPRHAADAFERANEALRLHAAFSGLSQENMNRMAGWRFLELGRRIERGIVTCRFVRDLAETTRDPGGLDLLLELCDSLITYGLRYVMVAATVPVVDLVLLDSHNPRSVAFQAETIEKLLGKLPNPVRDGRPSRFEATSASIATALKIARAEDLPKDFTHTIQSQLMQLSDEISAAFFTQRGQRPAAWEGLG
jgi:uncharacterized circularly permuted ATP-grasp superfamily protein/uncharacterized alpha-E superfamily protein